MSGAGAVRAPVAGVGNVVTVQPGDLLLAASDVDDRNIDLRNHRGPGRILHVGAAFDAKSILWTGVEGLLVGLAIDPADGSIWGADPTARKLIHLSPDGEILSVPALPERPWGTVVFDADGRMMLGVHTRRGPVPDDLLGAANLVRLEGEGWRGFTLRSDGGHAGFHQVSSIALKGAVAAHLAEGGRRIFLHDLDADRPLDPLLDMESGGDGGRVFGVCALAEGWLAAAGDSVLRLGEQGRIVARWPMPSERGWTRVTLAKNGGEFFVNNFLEGVIERRRVGDGQVVARHDIGRKCALCGVAEV